MVVVKVKYNSMSDFFDQTVYSFCTREFAEQVYNLYNCVHIVSAGHGG